MSELRKKLEAAQDAIVGGDIPANEVVKELRAAYNHATNNGPCPCGSQTDLIPITPRRYEDCCKREWIALNRGIGNLKEEMQKAKVEKQEEEAKGEGKWLCKIGIDVNGRPIVATGGMLGDEMNPHEIAEVLLTAYHLIMCDSILGIVGNAVMKLRHEAGMPPPSMPLPPKPN